MAQTQSGQKAGGEAGDKLNDEFQKLVSALAGRIGSGATERLGSVTDKLNGIADGSGSKAKTMAKAGGKVAEGKSPVTAALTAGAEHVKDSVKDKASGLKDKVTGALGGKGKGGNGKKLKVTNIIEEIDIGAPVSVVYNQWSQFQDFSGFMKKIDSVDQKDETEVDFKAQVLWSHRTWKGRIIEQVPDKRIIWKSTGEKGRVDGAVTFHEIGPDLTRVLVVLEYHPQGLFERTGNMWRAQGRRVRLELKHFRRHVMVQQLQHPDELEGWRGEIHEGEVTRSHEDAMQDESDEGRDDELEDSDEDYEDSDEDEDEGEGELEDSDEDSDDEDYEDDDELEDSDEDEYEDDDELEDSDEDSDDEEYEDEDELEDSDEDEYEDDEEDEQEPVKAGSGRRRR